MSRSGVLALAAVVIGGLGALWYFGFRDDGSGAAPAEPAPATTPAAPTGAAPALPSTPSAPSAPVAVLKSTGKPAVPQSSDGLEVRDHREPSTGAIVRQDPAAAEPAPIVPGTLHPTVSRALHGDRRAAMVDCGRLIQPSDRGAKPRIGATLKLAVKDGALRVVEVEPKLSDVSGADVDAAEQCVRAAFTGVEMPAPETPESDTVAFDVSYAIR
jgi:hypothetical protein